MAKDIAIPEQLGEAMFGRHQQLWKKECLDKLDKIKKGNVWSLINKEWDMKAIGNLWVVDIKHNNSRIIEKFKAHRDWKCPGIDCTKTYAPMASLISLHLVLAST
ncbi:hypothetical protein O181_010214 [Austropuccinia psidii MF-1]|uniref:Reverse transcriptase Ty1/copia-type domain-containing protein n=1 Tax=Austropuccinia psidii MF-1 TaxID=1389203 RepID=A0A9Q3GKM2_9BASI|nr:hypothetical protein [Austropuccinia psidii MF-1]